MNNLNQQLNSRTLSVVLTSLMIFSCMHCIGQDTIVRRDGQIRIGYITEVLPEQIRYKKISPTEGPVYVEYKAQVDRIKYSTGFIDVFPEPKPWQVPVATAEEVEYVKPAGTIRLEKRGGRYLYGNKLIKDNELYRNLLALNNPKITAEVRKAKSAKGLQYIGFAGIPLTVLGVSALSLEYIFGGWEGRQMDQRVVNFSSVMLGGAAASLGTSIYFKCKRKHHNREAAKLYKQQYE